MKIKKYEDKTLIAFSRPMKCISSAIWGGGMRKDILCVANVTIPQNINIPVRSMPSYSRNIVINNGYSSGQSVVLMTSVPQKYIGISDDFKCIVTAGLGNACSLAPETVWDESINDIVIYSPGTINCIIVLDDCLSSSAMVEGYGIAKLAIAEIISSWSNYVGMSTCVGTPTDCVALLCPKDLRKNRFAGIGTKIGSDIVYSVRGALLNAIAYKYPGFEYACGVRGSY